MNRVKSQLRVLVLFSLAVMLVAGCTGDKSEEPQERPIAWEDIPPVVQETIQKQAAGNTFTELEEITGKDGTFYEAEWLEGDLEMEIRVASDGKLLDREVEQGDAQDEDDEEDDEEEDQDNDDDI